MAAMPPKLTVEGKETWPCQDESRPLHSTDFSVLFYFLFCIFRSLDFSVFYFIFFLPQIRQISQFYFYFLVPQIFDRFLRFLCIFFSFSFLLSSFLFPCSGYCVRSPQQTALLFFICFHSPISSPCLIEQLWRSQMKKKIKKKKKPKGRAAHF